MNNRAASDTLIVSGRYGRATVVCSLTDATPVPASGVHTIELAADYNTVQGVCTAKDRLSRPYIVVCQTDFAARQSVLQVFRDTDGDGLPDQASKATLATVSNAELTRLGLDPASGTLYALDPSSSDKVLRFADTDGDLVPDRAFGTFVAGSTSAPIGPIGFRNPQVHSIEIYHRSGPGAAHPHRRLACTDTTGDGVADQILEVGRFGDGPGRMFGDFIGTAIAGEANVAVRVNPRTSWRVEGDGTGSWATLASFTGTNFKQTLTLSRSLLATESIRLVEVASGTSFAEHEALGTPAMVASRIVEHTVRTEGSTVSVAGKNFTGQESVEARVDETGTAWTACTINSATTSTLVIAVPEFGLPDSRRIWLRIRAQGASSDDYTDLMFIAVPD